MPTLRVPNGERKPLRILLRPVRLLAILCIANTCGLSAQAELTHRYTFNDGTANDSFGDADGVLLGNAFADPDGLLQLPGGPADFVSLDGAAINISSYVDATFEAWFTVNQSATWQRVFDFGDRTVPTGEQGYVYYTHQGGNGGGLGVYATGGERTEAPHGSLQTNHQYHLAMVIDDDANGGSDLMSIYLDGEFQTSIGHSRSLSDVSNTFAFLGESLVNDPNFNGTMDEFRIYDHAMSLEQVTSSLAAGPTPLPALRLEVNAVTGSTSIVNDGVDPITFDYYSIHSTASALDPDGWSSLDEQNLDVVGPADGESWSEATTSDSTRLIELYLLGASTVASNSRLDLGHAFDPTVSGLGAEGDLTFGFSRQGSQSLRTAEVTYVAPDPLDGDYNQNGTVDAADYVLWRQSLGSAVDLRADGDGDSVVDEDDYTIWRWTFGNTGGTGASLEKGVVVPEPSVVSMLALAMTVCLCRRGHRGP